MAIPRYDAKGWYVDNVSGVGAIYLSLIDEGFTTSPSDSPANIDFRPRIVNSDKFSIKSRPSFWPLDGNNATNTGAYGQLEIDNSDHAFDVLLDVSLRDWPIVFKLPVAAAYAAPGAASGESVIATAILNKATSSNDVITLELKGTITRIGTTLPVRRFPPFVDAGVAMRSMPILLGACRNVNPPPVDSANLIYQLSDAPITNVTAVRDRGALLDVHASPPQYIPAASSTCLQLQSDPQGKVTVDCSSVGAQSPIPGTADILAGAGLLTSWPVAGNPPPGWTYGSPAYGTITRWNALNSIQDYVAGISTRRRYAPASSSYGQYMYYPANLQPGRTYRISFKLVRTMGQYEAQGGLMLRTDLANTMEGAIAGFPKPLQQPSFDALDYTVTYTCPPGFPRGIYVIGVGDPNFASDVITLWCGMKVEELGQFVDLPMQGITLANYVREILGNRKGEPSIWNESDLSSIDAAAGYTIGRYFNEAPNVVDALQEALDSYCAGMFEDSDGVIRFARLIDPRLATPVFDLDMDDLETPIPTGTCGAEYLTTRIGAPRNWSTMADGDFVTDDASVPIEMRERFKRLSQYERMSTVTPSGEYTHAINAPIFDSLIDAIEPAQSEIDRVVKIFSPQVYPDGSSSTGKRDIYLLRKSFDDPSSFGSSLRIPVRDVLPGTIGALRIKRKNVVTTVPFFVLGRELFPTAQMLELEVLI